MPHLSTHVGGVRVRGQAKGRLAVGAYRVLIPAGPVMHELVLHERLRLKQLPPYVFYATRYAIARPTVWLKQFARIAQWLRKLKHLHLWLKQTWRSEELIPPQS